MSAPLLMIHGLLGSLDYFAPARYLPATPIHTPDLIGYGRRRSEEDGIDLPGQALELARLLREEIAAPAWLLGHSVGGAVAIDLASRRPVAGLAAFCSFTSLADMTRLHYPFLPTTLLRHRFDSERKLRTMTLPTLIGHAGADRIVPPAMSDRLAAAAAGPVTRFVVTGADHNEFFSAGAPTILAALSRFLNEHIPATDSPPSS